MFPDLLHTNSCLHTPCVDFSRVLTGRNWFSKFLESFLNSLRVLLYPKLLREANLLMGVYVGTLIRKTRELPSDYVNGFSFVHVVIRKTSVYLEIDKI